MTTHPPGQPSGPTGPGRVDDLDAELNLHHDRIGEPNEFSRPPLLGTADDCECGHGDLDPWFHLRPCPRLGPIPLPTLPGMVGDVEHLLTQALNVMGRKLDPTSLPQPGRFRSELEGLRQLTGFYVSSALSTLAAISKLPLPAVGSAIKLPVAAGKEPAPGSAAARGGAARESTGAVVAPGAGVDPDSSPGGGAPVSLSGRGVGPGVIAPTFHTARPVTKDEFAKAVTEAMNREAARSNRGTL